MVNVLKLIDAETILLEIDSKYKYELEFNDMYLLHKYLNEIGDITSYFFGIQNEYYEDVKDNDKLTAFHDKLINEGVEYDYQSLISFILGITEKLNKDYVFALLLKYGIKKC